MCNKDDKSSYQNSIKVPLFYCKQKIRFIYRHLELKKSFKSFLTEYKLYVRTII